jgi:hypothetical protein
LVTTLGDVVLADSHVLDLGSDEAHVWLTVEAALGQSHPRFYWPPHAGEQNAYAVAHVRLSGLVTWVDGPRPRHASDASGERDYGDASGWTVSGGTHALEGDWGLVTVAEAVAEVDWAASE